MNQRHQNFLVINGKTYDAHSGLEVKNSASAVRDLSNKVMSDVAPAPRTNGAPAAPVQTRAANNVSRAPQKAQTLARSAVRNPGRSMDGTTSVPSRSLAVDRSSRAASRSERATEAPRAGRVSKFVATDIAPVTTPKVENETPSIALAQLQSQHPALKAASESPKAELNGSELKEQLIQKRLDEAQPSREEEKPVHRGRLNSFFSKQPRLLTAAASAMCVLLLVGYVTYLNLPAISMRLAANRAGFAATMPGYKPSGYSLHGPVAYSPGQVNLAYASNTSDNNFTLSQRQSSWDSQALLDNYIAKQTKDYLTYQEKGLTIYMYDGKASWVNGGVWYQVDGSAKLSSDQILQMATSM